jgi:hypothetical protein
LLSHIFSLLLVFILIIFLCFSLFIAFSIFSLPVIGYLGAVKHGNALIEVNWTELNYVMQSCDRNEHYK